MSIARNTAEWVLKTDSPPRPPPGLGGSRIITQQVHQAPPPQVHQAPPPQVYRVPLPLVFADLPQESTMNISAPEWVPAPAPAIRRAALDVSMDEAMRNLRHASSCAEHAKKIANDAAIVARDATIAAQIAKEAALSASESVERAANILRELYQITQRSSAPAFAAPAFAAPAPEAAGGRTVSPMIPATSPIVAGGKVRHGAKFCFRKQKGRECKFVNGKCKWCR